MKALGAPEQEVFAFLLVLCRVSVAVMLLPAFGEETLPAILRAGIAFAFTFLLTPSLLPALPPEPAQFSEFCRLLLTEMLAGGLLGWLARLIALALPASGQIVSLATGMSSILEPDATLGAQSGAIGHLFAVLAPTLILQTRLYELPLRALAGSYAALPAGIAPPAADLVHLALRVVASHFALAIELAAPFLLAGTIWQIMLGVLSRLLPQVQIYFASLPGQVLGGVLLLGGAAAAISDGFLTRLSVAWSALPGY